MASLTNKYGAPRVFELIAANDDYTRGSSSRSITQLIDSPRVVNLRIKHDARVIEDVSEQYFSIMGRAIHAVLEAAGKQDKTILTERRYYAALEGWTISGAIDTIEFQRGAEVTTKGVVGPVYLQDYKHCTVWAAMNPKAEWAQQLNGLHWLFMHNNPEAVVKRLTIVCLIKDWSERDYMAQKEKGYPPSPIHCIDVPMWDLKETEDWLRHRVNLHQDAAVDATLDESTLIYCTDEERWMKQTQWAVTHEGNSRPTKTAASKEELVKYVEDNPTKFKRGAIYEERKGEPKRCTQKPPRGWCGVAEFCSQYREWQEENGTPSGEPAGEDGE